MLLELVTVLCGVGLFFWQALDVGLMLTETGLVLGNVNAGGSMAWQRWGLALSVVRVSDFQCPSKLPSELTSTRQQSMKRF